MIDKKRPSKISNPIHIGHHTVSGCEALNLAKRLSEELATHNQSTQTGNRAISPEVEPISRSYEGKKGTFFLLFIFTHINITNIWIFGFYFNFFYFVLCFLKIRKIIFC
jgi:hypothetical protein